MQPRGQLWFELEKVGNDFLDFSGLSRREGLETLISVFENMVEELRNRLEKAREPAGDGSEPSAGN